jgi:hypothetical protein
MLAPVYEAMGRWREARSVPPSLRALNDEDHTRILTAISSGDSAAASRAATEHLSTVFDTVVRTTVARGDAPAQPPGSDGSSGSDEIDPALSQMLALAH